MTIDDLREVIVNSNRDLASLLASLRHYSSDWLSSQRQFPQKFAHVVHDVLVQYEAEAARREQTRMDAMAAWQKDLAFANEQNMRSHLLRREEWIVNANHVFAAVVTDHAMVSHIRFPSFQACTDRRVGGESPREYEDRTK
jgi:hypothetical protein